jgi:hypothetical protein
MDWCLYSFFVHDYAPQTRKDGGWGWGGGCRYLALMVKTREWSPVCSPQGISRKISLLSPRPGQYINMKVCG